MFGSRLFLALTKDVLHASLDTNEKSMRGPELLNQNRREIDQHQSLTRAVNRALQRPVHNQTVYNHRNNQPAKGR
jgi:hypothetical protein